VVGFDSAWTDNPAKPGAICALQFSDGRPSAWFPPELASFGKAAQLIASDKWQSDLLLVALDQPIAVPNQSGSRPVDKVAGSLISWSGGGVQPANRGKLAMFGDGAPIWQFLASLDLIQAPELARTASEGRFVIEVFPALALLALGEHFFGRNLRPQYNPERRTFKLSDWQRVVETVQTEAQSLGCRQVADWLSSVPLDRVRKHDQDKVDAVICLLVGLKWRFGCRQDSAFIGCENLGHMVTPVRQHMKERLTGAALKQSVALT
jgi:predicted RNase H-like nuclease